MEACSRADVRNCRRGRRSPTLCLGAVVAIACAQLSCGSDEVTGLVGADTTPDAESDVILFNPDAKPKDPPLPAGFTPTDRGGWKLGEPIDDTADGGTGDDGGGGGDDGGSLVDADESGAGDAAVDAERVRDAGADGDAGRCDSTILGVARDFKDGSKPGGHPDFETFTGQGLKGIVKDDLGPDQKPVYAHTGSTIYTTSPENFRQWYVNTLGVNKPYKLYLFLVPTQADSTLYTFQSEFFFPVDGAGWGNEGHDHNFHFTTEFHVRFKYNGGEHFTFIGDDDLWVFINRKLAIDLGGLHSRQQGTVALDDQAVRLQMVVGNTYPLDMFHAERHTHESKFRIDTNMELVDCNITVTEPPR